jgi:hypothetical protein
VSDKPLVTNPNDKKQVEAAEEVAKRRERVRAEAWRFVLNTEQGRQVMQEILEQSGVDRTAAAPDSVNWTFLSLGSQNLGYFIKEQIDVFHEDALWQMKREQKRRMEN